MLDGEGEIIRRACLGEAAAFGELYDHYEPQIYRFILLKTGKKEEAEDLTHQVFLSAFQKIGKYVDKGYPFSSWLYQIARNQVIDYYRTDKNNSSIEELNPDFLVAPASVSYLADLGIEMERVKKAMRLLKPEYQDIVIMRFVEELSLKETAEVLNKSVGAVKLLQHRAFQELKKILGS